MTPRSRRITLLLAAIAGSASLALVQPIVRAQASRSTGTCQISTSATCASCLSTLGAYYCSDPTNELPPGWICSNNQKGICWDIVLNCGTVMQCITQRASDVNCGAATGCIDQPVNN